MDAALYPTRITHLHRSPVRHYGERRSYSWYVDLDDLPRLPCWLRPFARFEAADHFDGAPTDTLRQRVDTFLARSGMSLPGGRITALLMPRVLGQSFAPLSLFWCHDAAGMLRAVVAEVQTVDGRRHARLLPVSDDGPATVVTSSVHTPVAGDEGRFVVRLPEPGDTLDLTVALYRDNRPAMIATWRARRAPATPGRVLALQFSTPLAPLAAKVSMRYQALMLRLLGAPRPGRPHGTRSGRAARHASGTAWTANSRSWAPS